MKRGAALILAITLVALPAFADDGPGRAAVRLRDAKRAMNDFNFSRASQLLNQALAAGDATPELVWQIHWLLAQSAAGAGLAEAAEESFLRALELHPSAQLPADASPRLTVPMVKARAKLGEDRLQTQVTARVDGDSTVRVRVVLLHDVAHLIESGRVRLIPRDKSVIELARTDAMEGRWTCQERPCAFLVALRDARGNEVLRVGSDAAPLYPESDAPRASPDVEAPVVSPTPDVVSVAPASKSPTPLPSTRAERPGFRRAWPYLVAAGACLAVGSVFAVQAVNADATFHRVDANHTTYLHRDLETADYLRRRNTAIAGSAAAVAVGFGVVAAIAW